MFSLRSRFAVLLIAVLAIPLGLYWMWPHSRAMQHELQEVHERHLLLAQSLGADLQRYHQELLSAFHHFSGILASGNKLEATANQLLRGLRFRHLCIADLATGRILGGALTEHANCPDVIPEKRFALFKNLVARDLTGMSGVITGPKGRPTIYFVRRQDDRMVVGSIETSYFIELGMKISFGVRGHAAIVDQFGKVLSHPLPAWVATMKDISKVSAVRRMLSGEKGVEQFYSPALKDDMIAGFTSVKGPGWGVMIPQPMSELRDAASDIRMSTLTIFVGGVLIAGILGAIFGFFLVNPFCSLAHAVDRSDARDPKSPIILSAPLTPPEAKKLAAHINSLTDENNAANADRCAALEEARIAKEARKKFVDHVSQELRMSLDTINGFSALLIQEPHGPLGNDSYREYADQIQENGKHLSSLLDDLNEMRKNLDTAA